MDFDVGRSIKNAKAGNFVAAKPIPRLVVAVGNSVSGAILAPYGVDLEAASVIVRFIAACLGEYVVTLAHAPSVILHRAANRFHSNVGRATRGATRPGHNAPLGELVFSGLF